MKTELDPAALPHPNSDDAALALANRIAASNQAARDSNLAGLNETPPASDLFHTLAAAVFLESLGEPFPDVLSCLMAGQLLSEITAGLLAAIQDCLA